MNLPLRVLLVDDEELARLRLRGLVNDCREPAAKVVGEVANATQALVWLASQACDVLLLDIRMPGRDGMQLAAELQQRACAPALVFVTAHAEHALKAFDLEAVDYLTKPVRRERLQAALQRVAHRLASQPAPAVPAPAAESAPVLVVSDRGRVVRVPVSEVLYLKAELKSGRKGCCPGKPGSQASLHIGGNLAVEITMKELLEAGVHFGHQTRRWNPKMKEYIFGERNGIHIIDLQKTLKLFREAARYVAEQAAQGKSVLFLGTKRQAQEAIAEEAQRCGMFYVNHRWLGGTLTNWATLQKSIKRFKLLKAMSEDGRMAQFSKKEGARLDRELKHLQQNFAGVENMTTPPDTMFVIDPNAEVIAVREARRMGIPVVAIVDTNCDPNLVDWVIPGNDDALRAIRLFTSKISDAVVSGRQSYEQSQIADQKAIEGVAGEDGPEYVDTSAYEQYEKQEGDFVEGEPVATEEVAAPVAGDDDTSAK